MRHYRQTKQVRIDLRKIGVYTDKEWGTTQRKQYLARFFLEQFLSKTSDFMFLQGS